MGVARMIACLSLIILSHCIVCRATSSEIPQNVVLVVAKGMSSEAVTSTRIQEAINHRRNNSYVLSFEKFPHRGTLKTYYGDFKQGTSFSGATALFRGTYDQASSSCNGTSLNEEESIFSHAQRNKKSTGLVTTTRLTATLPATLYGVGPGSGAEECPEFAESNCSDISHFLVHGHIGDNMDVIFGDGSGILGIEEGKVIDDENGCLRNDGRNLIQEWKARNLNGIFINGTEEFEMYNVTKGEKVIGIYSDSELREYDGKDNTEKKYLSKVVTKAIEILKNNKNGYCLVVIVDHEDNKDNTVIAVSHLVDTITGIVSSKDTLLIVTSDHANVRNECSPVEDLKVSGKDDSIDNETESATETQTTTSMNEITNIDVNQTTISSITSTSPEGYGCAGYYDVPVYVTGPYPSTMPAVQDQALFGNELMKLIEAKQENGSIVDDLFEGDTVKIDSDLFQNDIKEALAEIDDMAKDFFRSWA